MTRKARIRPDICAAWGSKCRASFPGLARAKQCPQRPKRGKVCREAINGGVVENSGIIIPGFEGSEFIVKGL